MLIPEDNSPHCTTTVVGLNVVGCPTVVVGTVGGANVGTTKVGCSTVEIGDIVGGLGSLTNTAPVIDACKEQ